MSCKKITLYVEIMLKLFIILFIALVPGGIGAYWNWFPRSRYTRRMQSPYQYNDDSRNYIDHVLSNYFQNRDNMAPGDGLTDQ